MNLPIPSSSSEIFWAAWIVAIAVSFAAYEGYCLYVNKMTLSRSVWTWSQAFPLLPFIAGLLAGGLAVHFWWEGGYCAPGTPVLSMLGG
jgi:hypothetical protein